MNGSERDSPSAEASATALAALRRRAAGGDTHQFLSHVAVRMALSRGLRLSLLLAVMLGLMLALLGLGDWIGFVTILAAGLWMAMAVRSTRLAQQGREAARLLAAGQLEEAEALAREVGGALSLNRNVALGAVWVLAGVYARRTEPGRAAHAAAFLVGRPEARRFPELSAARLLLVESLLEIGDVATARVAVRPLYEGTLPLPFMLRLLLVQLRLEARAGEWPSMVDRLPAKLDLLDLLGGEGSARGQALLLLATEKLGRGEWAGYLRRRVGLLTDPSTLGRWDPVLRGLFAESRADFLGNPGIFLGPEPGAE